MNFQELKNGITNFWEYGVRGKRLSILDLVDQDKLPIAVGGVGNKVGTIGDLVRQKIGRWHPAARLPNLQLDLISEVKHTELKGRIGRAPSLGIGKGYAVLAAPKGKE